MYNYTITNHSVSVIVDGEPHVTKKGSPNFDKLSAALQEERWDDVKAVLTVKAALESWAQGAFKVVGSTVYHAGTALPGDLNSRIMEMATQGKDPGMLLRFWEKLQKNPSWRSVQQLFSFLKHQGIPITENGNFLAYKSVTEDFLDHYTKKVDNSVGVVNWMPRNQISDDPNKACHKGYHVGALGYARSFGSSTRRIVVVEVNPRDVVCVPYDHAEQKMGVCRYKVRGKYGEQLDDVAFEEDDLMEEWWEVSEDFEPEWGAEDLEENEDSPFDPEDLEKVLSVVGVGPTRKEEASTPKSPKTKGTQVGTKSLVVTEEMQERWNEWDHWSLVELANFSIAELRRYATYHIEIVGASKIKGGKAALLKVIERERQ